MRSRPESITDVAVLGAVREHWAPDASDAEYLPVGFGAHHWRVDGGRPLFVTLDRLAPRHSAASLEAAYAGAAALAGGGLDPVWPPSVAGSGRCTVGFEGGALSATGWLAGQTPTAERADRPEHRRRVAAVLGALHRARPPVGLPRWGPRVDPGFADRVARAAATPWTTGPLGEAARSAVRGRLTAIGRWSARYLDLAATAESRSDTRVATHGEPHHDNQVVTGAGLRFVDWESLALAPRERDLLDLASGEVEHAPDPAMVELFTLDWRIGEIGEIVRWFTAAHTGDEDDHIALDGLRAELAAGR